MANLSMALHTNFYQNRSSIVEVMTKNGVFYAPQCRVDNKLYTYRVGQKNCAKFFLQ